MADDRLDSFPKLLRRNATLYGDRPASREKEYGIWQSWTWKEVDREVRALAAGLADLGLKRGERLAIVGDNRPQLYWSMVAAHCIGAVPVPVYQDSVAEEMQYVLDHAEVRFAVVENQEQVDKLLSIKERVPSLQEIVYDDARGLRNYDHSHLHQLKDVQDRGRAASKTLAALDAEIDMGGPDDICIILYT
ncbi:MAG: AMP-binding protein, partial [Limibacillus sp.]